MTLTITPPGQTHWRLLESAIHGSDGDYYAWRTHEVALRGITWTLYAKPGMAHFDGVDPAAALMADHLDIAPDETAWVLHSGNGLVGAVAAAQATDSHVWLTDANVVAVDATRRTLAANGIEHATVVASHGASHLPGQAPIDVAAIRLPKGKQVALQFIWDAFQALRPGGRLFLAGANNEGIKSYLRHLRDLFGNERTVSYRKGCRMGVAFKPEQPPPRPRAFTAAWLDHNHVEHFSAQVADQTYTICSRPGVFSWDRLDRGTQVLLEAMEVGRADRVLDLGCGYGIAGIVAAARATDGEVHMVDANVLAVEMARRTAAANGATNCHVHLSDCATSLNTEPFDLIVTNPPFHHGKATQYDVAHQFMRDAAATIKPDGRFYLVANQFLAYEEPLGEHFARVETVYRDHQYKVLRATRARP